MKKREWVSLIAIIGLYIMMFFPVITFNNNTYNSFFIGFKEHYLNWSFYYFLIMPLVLILGTIIAVLGFAKEDKKLKEGAGWCWFFAFMAQLFFLAGFQGFEKLNQNLGVEVKYGNLMVIILLYIIAAAFEISTLISEYNKIAEKTARKIATTDYKNALKGKKIIYQSTVLLNPKWYSGLQHPDPFKLAVTNNEIIISSKPLIRIPFSNIKKISYMDLYQMALRIKCNDGKKYKLMYGPISKAAPYSAMETSAIANALKEIVGKKI